MNDMEKTAPMMCVIMLGVIAAFLWLVLDRLDLIIKLLEGSQPN
jgi:hypothetical protein